MEDTGRENKTVRDLNCAAFRFEFYLRRRDGLYRMVPMAGVITYAANKNAP